MISFTQNEIEQEISDAVPQGRRKDVARLTGIYPSIIYDYFNPEQPRKSPMFETLLIAAALDELDPEVGERFWETLCRLREMSRPHDFESVPLEEAEANNCQQSQDVTLKALKRSPYYEQLTEVLQQEAAVAEHKKSLLEKINREKASQNGNTRRFARRTA